MVTTNQPTETQIRNAAEAFQIAVRNGQFSYNQLAAMLVKAAEITDVCTLDAVVEASGQDLYNFVS